MNNNTAWRIPSPRPIPKALTEAGYTPLLAAVLAARGIVAAGEAAAFLDGSAAAAEPARFPDMDKAIARIERAVKSAERVAVYGDYDVDGITSTCLLADYLRGMGLETEIHIPNRLEEGYGVNAGAVEALHQKGVSLIITVDCGITAATETELARSLGIDMIITDHHECPAVLPAAVAVIDPKRPDCPAGRDLAGVGVAYKLVCALSGDSAGALARYADLVAVGTVADVMPLTGENRSIVKAGLQKLRQNPRPGLAALMAEAGAQPDRLSAATVGFTLAPRINAAGRLGLVRCAAELMLETDPARAAELAAELCRMNRERQQLEADIWTQAEKMLEGQAPDAPIVLAGENWHQGVIGIAASRLSDAYHVPAVMISLEGDKGKGSCRSYGDFNLFDALSACGDLLEGFGGHALAAGLNIARDKVDDFRAALNEYYISHPPCSEASLRAEVLIDSGELLSLPCVESLEALEPCGSGNPRPNFCLLDAQLVSVTPIGGGKHTSLRLEKFGQIYDCVWFSQRAEELGLSVPARVDAVFSPQISDFRGRRSVQLHMQGLRPADSSELCRDLLSGRQPEGVELTRSELAYLWRSLERVCPAEAELKSLSHLAPRLSPVKIAAGLLVLSELALAECRLEAERVCIVLTSYEGKADLMQSAAWRKYHR